MKRKMKLILTEPVEDLGAVGDEVEVAPGYGRNFLLPKGLAVLASGANAKLIQDIKERREADEEARTAVARELADKLSGVSVNIRRKVSEGDSLYGSVSAADVSAALAEEGYEIDKSNVKLEQAIKNLGIYEVPVGLGHGLEATVKVWVVREEGAEPTDESAEPPAEAAEA